MPDSDDSDDDLLLTTPVFRSSDRRRTLAQKKSGNAIEELIRNSKLHLEEATRIQQLQVENTQAEKAFEKIQEESVSAVKRKVEATQSGFFLVEDTEQLDVPERKRRAAMLDQMKGRYHPVVDSVSTIVFQPDAITKSFFYFSLEECFKELRSILSYIKDPKLKQAFTSVSKDPNRLSHLLRFLPPAIPDDLVAWMFRAALSEDIQDVHPIARSAHCALMSWMQRRSIVDLGLFETKQLQQILGSWRSNEKGVMVTSNKAGVHNLLRIVAQLPHQHHTKDPSAVAFQEQLQALCVCLSKSNGYRDACIVTAAEEVQALLTPDQPDDILQLASRITKNPQSVLDPWEFYPSLAKLMPYFRESDKMPDAAACSVNTMNAHLSMQALRHCLEGDIQLKDLLVPAFQLIDGVDDGDEGKNVDDLVAHKPLQLQAMASSYAGMQALRTHLEGLNSAKEANSQRCFAVGQASVLAFTSGLLLLGSTIHSEEEGGKEYGTRETMGFVFSLCDKLGGPLDFLTSYSNRYSADEYFRRLNCWLMILDFYRLETLKKLKPRFDDDTLIQKNLTSFFTKIAT